MLNIKTVTASQLQDGYVSELKEEFAFWMKGVLFITILGIIPRPAFNN
jgi:hypothetical protein